LIDANYKSLNDSSGLSALLADRDFMVKIMPCCPQTRS